MWKVIFYVNLNCFCTQNILLKLLSGKLYMTLYTYSEYPHVSSEEKALCSSVSISKTYVLRNCLSMQENANNVNTGIFGRMYQLLKLALFCHRYWTLCDQMLWSWLLLRNKIFSSYWHPPPTYRGDGPALANTCSIPNAFL